jgi:hypothetical protein
MEKGMEKTVIAKRLKVSVSTLYRYLVYTGMYIPKNCQQDSWQQYGIFH